MIDQLGNGLNKVLGGTRVERATKKNKKAHQRLQVVRQVQALKTDTHKVNQQIRVIKRQGYLERKAITTYTNGQIQGMNLAASKARPQLRAAGKQAGTTGFQQQLQAYTQRISGG